MPGKRKRIYWDANCFLHYLNRGYKWKAEVESLLHDADDPDGSIVILTSVLSKTEVAFTAMEKLNRILSSDEEAAIDALWTNHRGIVVEEYHDAIALKAREIKRLAMLKGKPGRRTPDIIHMATAQFVEADEMHTTEEKLHKFSDIVGFPIIEPYVNQLRLPSV